MVVVVVAEDAVHAVRRGERRQRFRGGPDVAAIAPRDVVAAEDDQVRTFVHQSRHGVRHIVVRDPAAAVDVGQEADAQAGERRRQSGHRQRRARDPERVALVQESVRAAPVTAPTPVATMVLRTARRVTAIDWYSNPLQTMANLFDELQWRGMVFDATEGLAGMLATEQVTTYVGFDPTASSLHVGSLLPVLALARLQRFGHRPIAVVGGGTGMIGDPTGKSQERTLLSREQIDENVAGIRAQLSRFLDFDAPANPARIVNNADWLGQIDMLSFLRDTGKYFTVNYMLQKESVNRRLESEDGISYTEFSYLLLQARDFVELFDRYHCTLQMGGSDQWGNITAGIELIRKLRAKKAHGLVWPLVTTASGVKFGKTEAGTVWLDAQRTSPFRFYQFWLNTDDRDVIAYVKYFTFLERAAIDELESATTSAPEKRAAQRVLAREVTALVHGAEHLTRAEHASSVLFSEDIATLSADDVLAVFEDVPSTEMARDAFDGDGLGIVDLVARVQLAPSKSEARRLVQSGGVYVNNRRVSDPQARVTRDQAIGGRLFVVRKGQKQTHLVRVVEAADRVRLDLRNGYEILSERSVARNSAREVRAGLPPTKYCQQRPGTLGKRGFKLEPDEGNFCAV